MEANVSQQYSNSNLQKEDIEKEKKKKPTSFTYNADRVVGNGSFGVVFQASVAETGEVVAIKKVY